MKLEEMVVDLETAKELQEKLESVGINVEACFEYQRYYSQAKWSSWKFAEERVVAKDVQYVPTYTLEEMLDILPKAIDTAPQGTAGMRTSYSSEGCFEIYYKSNLFHKDTRYGYHNAENCNKATAAAKLMIDLIDNGYIKKLDK